MRFIEESYSLRSENLGGPDNSLSGWPKATGSCLKVVCAKKQVVGRKSASCALRAPGQHTRTCRFRATRAEFVKMRFIGGNLRNLSVD
jgi:hypothetical protein